MYTDETLNCTDCNAPFTFSAGEQEFFAAKGFTNKPNRCPDCRAARRASAAAAAADATPAAAVADMAPAADARHAKCSRPPAADAAKLPRFRSNPVATSPCTAATASRSGSLTARPRSQRPSREPGRSVGRAFCFPTAVSHFLSNGVRGRGECDATALSVGPLTMEAFSIAILAFDGVDELDVVGPFEVFARVAQQRPGVPVSIVSVNGDGTRRRLRPAFRYGRAVGRMAPTCS